MKYFIQLATSSTVIVETTAEKVTKFVSDLSEGNQFVSLLDKDDVPNVINVAAIINCGPVEEKE